MTWTWSLLRAGAFKLDGGAMFGIVPKPLWTRLVEPDDKNRIPLQTNCLLLERGGHRTLIETGLGDKYSDKQRTIYDIEPRTIRDALAEAGVEPETISTVILTHLHFDHAAGLTRLDESGEAVSVFPRAEIVLQKREWEDALVNRSTMHSTYLRTHLDPVKDQVRLADGREEILEDIWVEPLPGHTWGHQGVFFRADDGETVVFPGDLMPTEHHASPTHGMAYDVEAYTAMQQKIDFLRRAVAEGWTIVLDHEPGEPVRRAVSDPEQTDRWTLEPAISA
jgi:glyoxylase-like metal-dependent hydrolase (beta-lactamase superfamily II)